jgi:hypothetical protein
MTSRLPREYCFRRSPAGEKVMVGRGLEPRPFGLQPSALPVKLTNQTYARGRIRTYALWFRKPALLVPLSYTDKPGSAGILACLLRSVGLCRKSRRQGCLRSQEKSQDGWN